jgi:hypothetical protein
MSEMESGDKLMAVIAVCVCVFFCTYAICLAFGPNTPGKYHDNAPAEPVKGSSNE